MSMGRVWGTIVLALGLAANAHSASTRYPEYSGYWWNPNQSGWGAHVTLNEDVIFMELFIYDAERHARFFVASEMRAGSSSSADISAANTFTGTLYRSRGSPNGVPFDPARTSAESVGTASMSWTSPATGVLTYSIDGKSVSQPISRQTWGRVNLAGRYVGGTFVNVAGCTSGLGLPSLSYGGTLDVQQSGDRVTITTQFSPGFALGGSCRMSGLLISQGSLASIVQGSYTCEFDAGPAPMAGAFELTEIEANDSGFSGIYRGVQDGSCIHSGRLGGIRRGF
jgi:hypothetical protein